MKRIIRIGRSGLAYIPQEIRKEGYIGDIECLPNAITFTLIRPGSEMVDVKRSLQNVIKDIDLRLEYEQREKDGNKTP